MSAKAKKRIKPVIEETTIVEETKLDIPQPQIEEQQVEQEIKTPTELPKVEPPPGSGVQKTNLGKILVVGFLTMIVVAVLSGAFYTYFTGLSKTIDKDKVAESPTPTAEPVETPSPTSVAKVDVSQYSVVILNGSGKIGEAGKVRDIIKTQKFNVITVGNADRYDYTDTIIKLQKNVPTEVGNILSGLLSKSYSTKVDVLTAAESKADILILVGSK